MRTLCATTIIVCFICLAIPAMADEQTDTPEAVPLRFSVSADIGYVFLTGHDRDLLEDDLAYGGSVAYRLTPNIKARLPFLYSHHNNKTLPPGNDADLSILSITPGLEFATPGKLSLWFSLGAGVSFVTFKTKVLEVEARERDTSFATRMGAGLDFRVLDSLSIGLNGAVLSSTREANRPLPEQGTSWETTFYYTALGRLSYSF